MAKRGVKVKEHERLEPSNIDKVIKLLANSPPITKKEACAILNISYNTTRLKNIIEQHNLAKASRKARFAKNRTVPIDEAEAGRIILGYLQGDGLSDQSEMFARSPATIKRVLSSYNVPLRPKGDEKYVESILPDECVSDDFTPGEIVWSAKYHRAAEVVKLIGKDRSNSFNVYRVYVLEPSEMRAKAGFYHDCASHQLGSLKHLKKLVNVDKLTS